MVTADVFWTHIERKAQPDMKPSNNLKETAVFSKRNKEAFTLISQRKIQNLNPAAEKEDAHQAGLTPTKVTSLRATLRWRPHFSMDVARQTTPTSRKWKLLKYSFAT